jgi:spermidine/putrescine transport system substrate-binding protein
MRSNEWRLAKHLNGRGDPINRRGFLTKAATGAGMLAAGSLLGACGDPGSRSSGTGAGASKGTVGGVLDLYTWEGYDGPDFVGAWRKQHGVTIKAGFIGSQDDVTTRLKTPAGAGTDASYVVQWYVDYYKQLNLLSPITVEEVAALGDLFPAFDQAPYKNEDGTFNSVPHNFGWNGLAYVPDRVKVEDPETWEMLFDPSVKGRIGAWDEPIAQIQLAAFINGFNPDQLTHEQLDEVKGWWRRLRPQIKAFATSTGDIFSLLSNGDVDVAFLAWNATDQFAKGAKAIIPREGAIGWVDAIFIPPDADNRATALAWCQLLLEGEVAAKMYGSFAGGATTTKVVPLLDQKTRKLFPYDDLRGLFDKLWKPRGFPRGESEFVTADEAVAAWQEIKAN